MIAKISLYSEIFGYSEIVLLHVLGSNDPVLVSSISTLIVMILFRIDWIFHLFVRLYNSHLINILEPNFHLRHFRLQPLFSAPICSLLSPLSLTF